MRKMSDNIGVERIFPIESPFIDSITVNKFGKVRRAKLYYLRNLTGKKRSYQRASCCQQVIAQQNVAIQRPMVGIPTIGLFFSPRRYNRRRRGSGVPPARRVWCRGESRHATLRFAYRVTEECRRSATRECKPRDDVSTTALRR